MEEKNLTKISLSTFLLIIAIIAIIVMGIFIYKLNNDKTTEIQKSTQLQSQVNSLNGTVSDLQGKINSISNTINNNSATNTNANSNSNSNTSSNYYLNTNITADATTQDTTKKIKENDHKETENNEIIGKWNACKAINSKEGNETTNMRDIFGSSYAEFGSYIELKEDGSFLDAIQPITDGSKSVIGSYSIERDYYKSGDCYIFLTYSDGSKNKLQLVYYDDSNTPYLVLDSLIRDYQISFKK